MDGWTRVGVTHQVETVPAVPYGTNGYMVLRILNVNRNDETSETRLHHNGARILVESDGSINITGGTFDLEEAVAIDAALGQAIALIRATTKELTPTS